MPPTHAKFMALCCVVSAVQISSKELDDALLSGDAEAIKTARERPHRKIHEDSGIVHACAGDWVLTHVDGRQEVLSDDEFKLAYGPASQEAIVSDAKVAAVLAKKRAEEDARLLAAMAEKAKKSFEEAAKFADAAAAAAGAPKPLGVGEPAGGGQ